MRVLVTGAAGFLGSNLVKRLLKDNHVVYGLDNYSTGRLRNLQSIYDENWKGVTTGDVTDSLYLPEVDLIFNFACPASPPAYQSDPVHTMMTCVLGTKNMLDHARKHDAIFVQASTSEIYGDPDISPQNESYKGCVNTWGIRACYDEGKRAAEALCHDYNTKYGTKVKVARIFNTYGPGMDPNDGRVVSNFIVQSILGEKLTLYGEGNQTRSFCYVDDLIEGFIKLSQTDVGFCGPINLGNPNEFTITDLAFKVISLVRGIPEDSSSIGHRIKQLPLPQDDPKQRCPDITLAKSVLSWEPKIQLDMGLAQTIEYFRRIV